MVCTMAQSAAAACTFFSSSIAVVSDAAPLPPTSGRCPWGEAVVFDSSYLPSDSLARLGFFSSIAFSGRVSCRSPVVALGSFGMWWVSPPCCGAVISVSGDFCYLWSRLVRYVFTGWLGGFGISISNSYVLCHFRSPCNCDSDEGLDCFRSPVVVAVDVVRCVGGGSTVSVAVLPIVVELSGLVAELPVSVARMLYCRTLYIIFKRFASIISWAIHVRTFCISCWKKESGCWMSMKAAKRHKNIPQSQLLVCSGICVSGGGPE